MAPSRGADTDKAPPRRSSNAWLPQLLRHVGEHTREIPAHLLLWTLFSSAATVCLLNSLRSHRTSDLCAHRRQHESLRNQHTDKPTAELTRFNVAEENEKEHEEEEQVTKDDAEEDGKEQEEVSTSEEEHEVEIEEEVNAEDTEEDSLRKRK